MNIFFWKDTEETVIFPFFCYLLSIVKLIFFTKNYAVCLWDLNPGLLCPLHPITHSLVDDQIDQNIKIC